MQGLMQKLQDTLKSNAIRPAKQAQIPLTSIPKQRGGAGRGQGRKPINGEKKQSKVIRVPLNKLDAVNAVLTGSSPQPAGMTIPPACLNLVTEIIKIAENQGKYALRIPSGEIYREKSVIKIFEELLNQVCVAEAEPVSVKQSAASQVATPIPAANVKNQHRVKWRYAMRLDGIDHYWSGRGRMPKGFADYVYSQGGNYENHEGILSKFLIK